ncbi:MAG TPA: glycosyltransferase family 4 protein [Planctomycetota bacterium]|nr:glycosyltransferase family 4 protein [Planctomycetota bacterium]
MNVLHLVSNHKLTGPVDPAIRLARALLERNVSSRIAVGRPAPGKGPLDDPVRDRGLEPITELLLPKHRRLFVNRADVKRLCRMLEAEPADVLHAHLDNAHGVAVRARHALARALRQPPRTRRPIVVRSLYDGEAPQPSIRYRWLYGRESDGVFVFGETVRRRLLEQYRLPPERVVKLDGAVDTDRYRPREPGADLREQFGIGPSRVVVGIVARIQRHRRFETLLEAMRKVFQACPEAVLLVLGRGTLARQLAHDTAQRLGIGDRVVLPGYVGGDQYPKALACFDIKVYLVPGSDGTCRAAREAMACGIPLVVSRRGLLPEIVRDGVDGYVVDDTVETLARTISQLVGDVELRVRLGENALQRAREDFSLRKQAEVVLEAYRRWLDAR